VNPRYELAQVIERFGDSFNQAHAPNTYVKRILRAIKSCRTAALGGHVDACEECGCIRISYNSCRNRHCPKCQNTQREAWIESRKQDLLPIAYFHVVFTLPYALNGLFLKQPVVMYNLLFKAAWETIAQFSFTNLHSESGMIAVLHTWGQNLSLHPHLHCIVPGGGINYKGKFKEVKISKTGRAFLFPVKNMSKVYRAKFISSLHKQSQQGNSYISELYKNNWVVYAKEPFAGPEQVVEYLGRYTHKVAISNHRIMEITDKNVRFKYRDYRDNIQKEMTLSGSEFLRRFCQHILPKSFVRIRHYGLLATTKRIQLRQLQKDFGINVAEKKKDKHWKQICREHLRYDPDLCPHCKEGFMVTIMHFDSGRAPPAYIYNQQIATSK
jgi:hypothetical protein